MICVRKKISSSILNNHPDGFRWINDKTNYHAEKLYKYLQKGLTLSSHFCIGWNLCCIIKYISTIMAYSDNGSAANAIISVYVFVLVSTSYTKRSVFLFWIISRMYEMRIVLVDTKVYINNKEYVLYQPPYSRRLSFSYSVRPYYTVLSAH